MTRLDLGIHAFGPGLIHSFSFCLALLLLLGNGAAHESETYLPPYEVVHPTRVDARGHFLSNFLSHHARRVQRRDAPEGPADSDRVFYQLWHDGHRLHFDLTLNPHLLAPGFLTERRYGGLEGAKIRHPGSSQCHFLGEVWDGATVKGSAAISTCDGLTGLFKLSDEEFFIQPLEKTSEETSATQAHAVYKRHATPPPRSPVVQLTSGKQAPNGTCGIKDSHQSIERLERQRERWELRQQRRRRRIRQRSVSKEKWVETLVVADPKMVEHHGSKSVEGYILSVMNIVAGLFSDASIGNAINIVVVRLILLEKDEDDLKITHHADHSLNSFCKWQKKLNMKGDEHPLHHDVAVLLTRKDICAAINTPCETLGLSHVAGMCQLHRSCSISEDTGLPVAFTVAHEMGHNFGIQHDGNGNDCEPIGKRPFVMSPQLLYGTSLPRWSRCSRQYITRFLDRGWGWCLDDAPAKEALSLNSVLPGVLYNAAHQCRLQYGPGSLLCDDMDNVCSTLWCTVGTTCHSKLDGAVDGTSCGEDKWCISGECIAVGYEPDRVDGGWGSWSEWSTCSRTCGAGVHNAHRDCDNPVPKYRGKYCLGERRRYKICNTTPCPHETPSFRDIQCSSFNSLPYKGSFYKWESVINHVSPCELHCRPLNEHFSEKMRDAIIDGTPCYEGNKSRDMCINGICKNVGCDFVIESGALEDRCGVCGGNGSTCTTVKKTFEETQGLGYVDIGLIPEGAWDIRIEEVAEAGNFLALRSDNPNKYYLNGGWTIQWNGEYKAAGTVFTYERTGHLENLTSPGPTMEPLWIQLLFQETNPGVRYEYTISRNISEDNKLPASVFFWKYGSWTECSVTCGTGVQRQIVHCVEKTTGIVEEHFCDPLSRPDDNQTSCNKDPCPAIWWAGEWNKCSASCGSSGVTRRTVLCIQAVNAEEQEALLPTECEHLPKPASLSSCNRHIPCPADWTTDTWSKCSVTCGSGVRRRNVTCSRNTGVDCDPQKKPLTVTTCYIQDCPEVVDNFGGIDLSGSGWSSKEVLNEINSIPEVKPPKFSTTRAQPRTHNTNINKVVEGDFHYHNNIENIDQSPDVQVDDFYYDYNFINFHEDLSEDTEGEKTTEEESVETNEDNVRDNGDAATNKSMISEDMDSILSEDYLLPVSPTHPPSLSKTGSQTPAEEHDESWGAENITTMPSLVSSTMESSQDGEWGRHSEEDEINYANSTEEENFSEKVTVAPTHAAPTPGDQTTTTVVSTTVLAQETEEEDSYEYSDNEKGTLVPDMFAGKELLSSPESIIQTQADIKLEEIPLEISQTSQSTTFSPVSTSDDLDEKRFNAVYATSKYPWDTDHDLSTTSFPASGQPTTLLSLLETSGNQEVSDDESTSLTGPGIVPLTDLEEGTRPSPATFTETTAQTQSTNPDYNGTVIPQIQMNSSKIDPGPTPQYITTINNKESPTSTVPSPWTPPSATSTQGNMAAYWVTGNWSACSTTCGLGAIWRTLACSTGTDSDCDLAKRPTPAQRCYVRPCSTWKVEEWSKCSKNCEGGIKSREVQCFDMRDQRPLRPFHCRAMSSRPRTQTPCNLQPCLSWYTSSWGQCSEVCGGGEQQRIVTCPEEDGCDRDLMPSSIQSCNNQSCAQWLTGSWGQCSASCSGGVQHRLIQCVNTKGETDEDVDPPHCDPELQPESTRKCNLQECESSPNGAACLRDRLTLRFCHMLRFLGRCHLPNVRTQCCRTCSQRSRSTSIR